MPIIKDGSGAIVYTEPLSKQRSDETGTVVDDQFAIVDNQNVVKQIQFRINPLDGNPGVLTINADIGADSTIDLGSGAVRNPSQVFADAQVGDDATADGSPAKPFKTLNASVAYVVSNSINPAQISLAPGVYSGPDITWPENCSLIGTAGGSTTQVQSTINFTSVSDQTGFYASDVSINLLNFDFSASTVCLATLRNGGYSFNRTGAGGVGTAIICSDSYIGTLDITKNCLLNNCLFTASASKVRAGGALYMNACTAGTPLEAYDDGVIGATASLVVGGVTGFPGSGSPTLRVDASSLQSSATNIDIVYIDAANAVSYDPGVPLDWLNPPTKVSQGLNRLSDAVANNVQYRGPISSVSDTDTPLTGFTVGTPIDSVPVADGDVVFLLNQADPTQIGVYDYSATDSAFTPNALFPVGKNLNFADLFFIYKGTTYGQSIRLLNHTFTIGSATNQNFLDPTVNGASDSFTTADLRTVTVVNGLITSIV